MRWRTTINRSSGNFDSDRQQDSDEGEAVAESKISGLAQIDRRPSADFDAIGLVTLFHEIAAHRAGDARAGSR